MWNITSVLKCEKPYGDLRLDHQHQSLLKCSGTLCHCLLVRLSLVITHTHTQTAGWRCVGSVYLCGVVVIDWLVLFLSTELRRTQRHPPAISLCMFRMCLISWCLVMQAKYRLKLNGIMHYTQNGHIMQIRLAQVLYIRFSWACVLFSFSVSVESCYCIDSLVSLSVTSTSLSECLHGAFVRWYCDVCSFET